MLKLKYKVFSNDLLIGQTDLEFSDSTLESFNGEFFPSEDYVKVKPIFLKFGRATIDPDRVDQKLLDEYYKDQPSLGLRMETQEGTLFPASTIHIYDYSFDSEIGEEYMIDVYP